MEQAKKLSPAGKRAAKLYRLRQVPHEVSHRRDRGKVVGVCTCGFETWAARVKDARLALDKHLGEADPDQLVRRVVAEVTKITDRYLKQEPDPYQRNLFRLEVILQMLRRIEGPLDTERQKKQLEVIRLTLEIKCPLEYRWSPDEKEEQLLVEQIRVGIAALQEEGSPTL